MASNFFKVDKGVTLAPQSSVASPQNGDVYYDSTRNTYVFRNNGASVDLQSRSDVGTASSLTSANFTSTVIQSNLIKLTGSTVSNIHGITASSDAKMIVLYNGSSAVVTIKNASGTEATAGNRILTSTGADVNLNAGEAVQLTYDSTQARWIVVSTPGGSANGGTGKNYLTTYKNNPGNGNFESASTTGWSLGTTGTLTNGLPTGSPTFGSGASGNLSISTVSSGQLAGSYSLSYASSAATTQGNMLASDAFSIDLEDQAKVLTWKFYYKAQTNPSNANWSGTSSNSFGVAVWDVTNSTWLPTTASFGMTQSSGVGVVSGTVQTASNAAQLRLVVYNVNATSGAITLYFDDFSFGPQTTLIGSPTNYLGQLPTTGSFTTNSTYVGRYWRDADFLVGRVTINFTGAPNATGLTVNLPLGLQADSSKLSFVDSISYLEGITQVRDGSATGYFADARVLSSQLGRVEVYSHDPSVVPNRVTNVQVTNTYPFSLGNGDSVEINYRIPIQGWDSQVQMSNDTDTRVVAFRASSVSGNLTTSFTTVNFGAASTDTHGAWNGSTTYTVPVSGIYTIEGLLGVSLPASYTGTLTMNVVKNGSAFFGYSHWLSTGVGGSNVVQVPIKLPNLTLAAGDTISIQALANNSWVSAPWGASQLSITRLSGPSVIAANETVAMSAQNTSGQSTNNNTFTTFTGWTTLNDSHGAFNASTGIYTIPVSGIYSVCGTIAFNGNATSNRGITILKNGSTALYTTIIQTGAAGTNNSVPFASTVKLLAGDTLALQIYQLSGGPLSATTAGNYNQLSIVRLGN